MILPCFIGSYSVETGRVWIAHSRRGVCTCMYVCIQHGVYINVDIDLVVE